MGALLTSCILGHIAAARLANEMLTAGLSYRLSTSRSSCVCCPLPLVRCGECGSILPVKVERAWGVGFPFCGVVNDWRGNSSHLNVCMWPCRCCLSGHTAVNALTLPFCVDQS